ncbi:MAG: 5-(carboxyamino)imidazole ribonucleotide synthase [Chloroherpetonaceae bacterium]|nr:5-(carboxyamino)imidazole ribonucleotide synthase [Chthonomonadaceae bacterium]MDW8207883.1 5-(carboxyamino)imidazole ribonucleotide synthase [Chloroherpetonaceae bacterium]
MRIGVLGGGQLGRMLALAGYPLGLRFRFFDPHPESPAGHLAELVTGAYDDVDALAYFGAGCDLITYEFENVPFDAVQYLTRYAPVYPPPEALAVAQDRLREKETFTRLGIPTPVFDPVDSRVELNHAVERFGLPAVLKTRRFGYDGKGQQVLRTRADVAAAWEALQGSPLLFEGFIPFERELSLVAVRGREGQTAFYPLVENWHEQGILRRTLAPAPQVAPELQQEAERHLTLLMETLNYVGVLTVEFFQHEGRLIANEMAPRVHNSGHWTIEGAVTSQFENHLRAICGLPLGVTATRGSAGMINLIGTTPAPEKVLEVPGAHLHLYGKQPRAGRKLGHITVVASDPRTLEERLQAIQACL